MSQSDDGSGSNRRKLSSLEKDNFNERSRELGRKLESLKMQKTPESRKRDGGAAASQGFKVAVELVVGVCFGGVVGWSLDRYFETSGPWFLIVFVLLGFAAGMLNVIRMAQRLQAQVEAEQQALSNDKACD